VFIQWHLCYCRHIKGGRSHNHVVKESTPSVVGEIWLWPSAEVDTLTLSLLAVVWVHWYRSRESIPGCPGFLDFFNSRFPGNGVQTVHWIVALSSWGPRPTVALTWVTKMSELIHLHTLHSAHVIFHSRRGRLRTQKASKLSAAGASPRPHWGSLQHSPRPPSWWGGNSLSLPKIPPPSSKHELNHCMSLYH